MTGMAVDVSIAPRAPRGGGDQVRVTVGDRVVALQLVNAGLACCAVEVAAALQRLPRDDAADGHGISAELHVLLVSGTVTDRLAPAVLAAYDALPEPRRVISYGACSNSGGPYWDSYSVTKGVDQLLPVDLFVPGCPPRPEAMTDAVVQLVAKP